MRRRDVLALGLVALSAPAVTSRQARAQCAEPPMSIKEDLRDARSNSGCFRLSAI